ncbi:hypothetical protein [Mameliella alba]|uniref:hypothetical protein n=1 Tax=Mameliella alba TaxID=561184 RepID=UPI003CC914FB
MSMRLLLWAPLAALVALGAVMAFRAGWIAAHLTESMAIERYAARYMAETGAQAADCSAVPGARVWLVIRCGTGQDRRVYRVNRFGGLVTGQPADGDRMKEPST